MHRRGDDPAAVPPPPSSAPVLAQRQQQPRRRADTCLPPHPSRNQTFIKTTSEANAVSTALTQSRPGNGNVSLNETDVETLLLN